MPSFQRMIPFVKLILRPKTASFKRQISTYSPEVIKKDKDTCLLQSHLPPKKVSCGTDRISVASGKSHFTQQSTRYEISMGRKNKKQQNRQCQVPTESLPLGFLSVCFFELKLKVIFRVQSFRTCQCISEHLLMLGNPHFYLLNV